MRDDYAIGQGWFGTVLPRTHDINGEGNPERQDQEGHDPGHAIEAGSRGGGDYGWAILLHEALQDEVVTIAAALVERGLQLIAHLVGGLASDVIAFQQDLAASAGAHHAVAEVFEAGGVVSGAHENNDRERECGSLQAATKGRLHFAAKSRSFALLRMTIHKTTIHQKFWVSLRVRLAPWDAGHYGGFHLSHLLPRALEYGPAPALLPARRRRSERAR